MEGSESSIPPEQKSQLAEIAKTHGTNTAMVNNLFRGGVSMDDIGLVIDVRDGLTVDAETAKGHGGGFQITRDSVSARVLADAYRAVEGDIDALEALADEVNSLAGDRRPFPGLRQAILTSIVDSINDGERPPRGEARGEHIENDPEDSMD
jgi:hypothetical protein